MNEIHSDISSNPINIKLSFLILYSFNIISFISFGFKIFFKINTAESLTIFFEFFNKNNLKEKIVLDNINN